jgi:hypothetical protein
MGKLSISKTFLARNPDFTLDQRTRHLLYRPQYGPPVEVDVLTAFLAKMPYPMESAVYTAGDGIRILHPTQLLQFKLSSVWTRTTDSKKATDWYDIYRLISWHVRNKVLPTSEEVITVWADCLENLKARGYHIPDTYWAFIASL